MKSLIAGAIGGMCPCLITLGKVCTTITPGQHFVDVVSPWFFAGILVYAVLGLTVAFFFTEPDAKKAFVLGISAPALIASVLANPITGMEKSQPASTNSPATPGPTTTSIEVDPGFIPVSWQVVQNETRGVNVSNTGDIMITANFFGPTEALVTSVNVLPRSGQRIAVPTAAKTVQFQAGTRQTEKYSLNSNANITPSFEIRATSTKKYGFLQGLGAPPDADIQINVVEGNSGLSG
jgi:hypothetical protein